MDVLYKGILPLELEVYRKVRQDARQHSGPREGGVPPSQTFHFHSLALEQFWVLIALIISRPHSGWHIMTSCHSKGIHVDSNFMGKILYYQYLKSHKSLEGCHSLGHFLA